MDFTMLVYLSGKSERCNDNGLETCIKDHLVREKPSSQLSSHPKPCRSDNEIFRKSLSNQLTQPQGTPLPALLAFAISLCAVSSAYR